jgi:plastocyanin
MRGARRLLASIVLPLVVPAASPLAAQSLLGRSPNVNGAWIAPVGTVQFNFLHRFVRSDAPERKITSFPTFIVGTGVAGPTMAGFIYSTNSTLVDRYPNEWEFFARALPLEQRRGAPLDVGVQGGYNLAVKGLDGGLTLGRDAGPVRLEGELRLLDPVDTGRSVDVALGGGAVVRLGRYFALAGDVVSLTHRSAARNEKVAWSAGVQVALPGTPHTLSVQATNTNTATLEGASRGSAQTRYGFEFTIPITLARFFGHARPKAPGAAGAARADTSATPAAGGAVRRVSIHELTFPARLEVAPGTTVTWVNDDPLDHSVVATDGSFDSGLIHAGGTWSHTFNAPGTYAYSCTPHPFMHGTVVVREAR